MINRHIETALATAHVRRRNLPVIGLLKQTDIWLLCLIALILLLNYSTAREVLTESWCNHVVRI